MVSRRARRRLLVAALAVVVLAVARIGPALAFHVLPPRWTGEADRLAEVLAIGAGARVADVGAGDGDMAFALAERVGEAGIIYATEISADLRDDIGRQAAATRLRQIVVVEAGERTTGLPSRCCDALFLRNVLHHIGDWPTYAGQLRAAVKDGGLVAIIDFEPGRFWFLGTRHGARQGEVIAAFRAAGFRVEREIPRWGGGMYLVAFR